MPRKSKIPPAACRTCGIPFVRHLGLQGTCAELQTALETLRQIVTVPKLRGAKYLAKATLHFLETQASHSTLNSQNPQQSAARRNPDAHEVLETMLNHMGCVVVDCHRPKTRNKIKPRPNLTRRPR